LKPAGATPTRVALIADPQLVDPHTYDRSKVLMIPTMYYTDKFLARSYRQLLSSIAPSHIFFLGDLFDGGREWNTKETHDSPKGYGHGEHAHYNNPYWHGEYERFQRIFPDAPGIVTVKSLPGNHDLGFGQGIKSAVHERFTAFFGETNSVWEVGNHSFVLLDTVSLSDDRKDDEGQKVGEKAREWLNKYAKGEHQSTSGSRIPQKLTPTVLLTHVPLYRLPNTNCGNLREARKKHGGGISISKGYQYANVLTYELTQQLLKIVTPQFVFSGDDHDYCVVEHVAVETDVDPRQKGRSNTSKEVTVKSFSWAMGVRRPGFVLVSLWNPNEKDAEQLASSTQKKNDRKKIDETEIGHSVQSHLCLLPDQIGIFINYALLFAACFVVVLFNNIRSRSSSGSFHSNKPFYSSSRSVLGGTFYELYRIALVVLPLYVCFLIAT